MPFVYSSLKQGTGRFLLCLLCCLLVLAGLTLNTAVYAESGPGTGTGTGTRAETDTDTDTTARIIRLSGVMGISDQVRQLALRRNESSQVQRQRLRTLVDWAPAELERRYQGILDGYSETELATLLNLLESPLMQRAREAEALALSEQGSAAYEVYMQRLQEQPPAKARRQRIELILNRNGMWQWMLKARASVPMSEAIAEPEQIRQLAEHFLLYAYRTMDNHSLDELNRLWAQPALQRWLNDAYHALPSSDGVHQQKSSDNDQVITSDSAG